MHLLRLHTIQTSGLFDAKCRLTGEPNVAPLEHHPLHWIWLLLNQWVAIGGGNA